MGVGYILANLTKREQIGCLQLPVNSAREICGHPFSAAIVSWYLLQNSGDTIRFVDDHGIAKIDHSGFVDRTAEVISELIANQLEALTRCWRTTALPHRIPTTHASSFVTSGTLGLDHVRDELPQRRVSLLCRCIARWSPPHSDRGSQ